MPGQQTFRIGNQRAEDGIDVIGAGSDEHPGGGAEHIGQRPAGDHAVIGQDDEPRHYTAPAQVLPAAIAALFRGQGAQRIDGALPTATTQHDLGHHDRDADQGDADQVDEHEGPAAVLTGDIGEFPDIAQTDGRAGRRQQKGHA